jgi:hypothetical protein
MNKIFIQIIFTLFTGAAAFAQEVKISMIAPPELRGRKAILLTREKGFAAVVHSVKISPNTINLQIDPHLLPDLYQLHVSRLKGSLYLFLEPGIQIHLDTSDVAKSVITNSKTNQEWQLFRQSIQVPYDERLEAISSGEDLARKENNPDSLNYWFNKKNVEQNDFLFKTKAFILNNPGSFVSLYLLKTNWYNFRDNKIFEQLDTSLASHKTYHLLKRRSRELAGSQSNLR